MKTATLSPLLVSMALLTTSLTTAQSRIPETPATVQLFSQSHFRGESITLRAGEKLDDFNHVRFPSGRNANNRVSSIRIHGQAHVTLFDYRSFEGESITLRESVARLDDVPQRSHGDWDNELSSIVTRPQIVAVTGCPHRSPNFGSHRLSATVRHGKPHPSDRERSRDNRPIQFHGDRQTALVVQRAYEDVLGRQPDANGLANYVKVLQTRGWSESQLRRELRRSPEYRSHVVPRKVTAAYRAILAREPDPAGFQFYTGKMIRDHWTVSRVRDALKRSPEYAARLREKDRHTKPEKWG